MHAGYTVPLTACKLGYSSSEPGNDPGLALEFRCQRANSIHRSSTFAVALNSIPSFLCLAGSRRRGPTKCTAYSHSRRGFISIRKILR